MNKQECQICDKNHFLEDSCGGKWSLKDNALIIKQSFQEYAGGPFVEEIVTQKINYCPMCGRRLKGDGGE
ncbi:hypothetical protein NGH88_12300 [Enterococcus faecalis]|uniref:hypothetical protein n=1 Tax=Enterococcus faecalis TaxID=1351 RepID=UPI002DBE2590|nr:hypothetical protein [Enterococcus faecalis]MEB7921869.1 hypothetical protein [Enterococcus faecalis]